VSISIHISDVRSFRSCRRKWFWSSRLGENLEPIVPYPPFFTGKAIHAALEFFYRDRDNFEKTLQAYFKQEEENLEQLGTLWPEEVEKLQEQVSLIEGIIDNYVKWQAQDETLFSDKNLEFVDMEVSFTVPLDIAGELVYEGRLDGLVKHIPTGEYYIWEAKTARSVQELIDTLPNDEQSTMYLWAARQIYDFPIKGVLYNIMRKKEPSVPRKLQSGLLSTAKSIDTTSYFYRSVVKIVHPDWSDETIDEFYSDIIETLRLEKDNKFFTRFPVYRNPDEIARVVENIHATAKEMTDPSTALYPSPGWMTCRMCTFRSACLTLNAGGNYRDLLNAEFQKRQSHESMRHLEDSDDE